MGLKEGRKLCSQLSSRSKNQKNVNWESILSELHYLRPIVEVGEVFSLARMIEKKSFLCLRKTTYRKQKRKFNFFRDAKKGQTCG